MTIPDEIIKGMEIPSYAGIFQIGSNANRVTVYAQQVRALNLVWALKENGSFNENSRVAIIGGGAAGLTSALGFGRLGCQVTVFERQERLLSRFRGNTQRFLHPHLFDWPFGDYWETFANLPLMNWRASTAHDVTLQMERAFAIEKLSSGKIDVKLSVNVSVDGRALRVNWSGSETDEADFDLIVFAVGVGTEERRIGTPLYWENDSLSQIVQGGPKKILVSGNGDGGLIDAARALMHDFDHGRLISQFLTSPTCYAFSEKLMEIETRIYSTDLDSEYSKLDLSGISELVTGYVRKDREVTLYVTGRSLFDTRSMILNRLIIECLRRDNLKIWKGEGRINPTLAAGGKFEVESGNEQRKFDLVIQRHGPKSDIRVDFERFCGSIPQSMSEPDQTQFPAWPDNFFKSNVHVRSHNSLPPKLSVIEIDAGFGLESRAWSMNENGSVVGWSYLPTYSDHGFFLWDGSGLAPKLGIIPYSAKMSAQDINANGDFVVVSEGGSGQGLMITSEGVALLKGPYSNGMPYSINDDRTVVGYTNSDANINSPCIWKNGEVAFLKDFGHGGVALQLNNSEVVVGEVRMSPSGPTAAAKWTNGLLQTFVPPSAYREARCFRVNSHGCAAGYLIGNDGSSDFFVWPFDDEPRIIGQGEAYGINDSNWVAGRSGEKGCFLYDYDGKDMHWLDDLVDKSWSVKWPFILLNDFRMAGVAKKDGVDRAVILVPER